MNRWSERTTSGKMAAAWRPLWVPSPTTNLWSYPFSSRAAFIARLASGQLPNWFTMSLDPSCWNTRSGFLSALRNFGPRIIEAYARAAVLFSQYLEAKGLAPPQPHALVTSAEVLEPEDRALLIPIAFRGALTEYQGETFDALVAWDIFNYYDPGAMTLLAAEARRILKPGGLLLGYFHARRPEGPETPRRYRILDEGRVACDRQPGPPLRRHVYQNRDIEKMFMGLSIVELYFLKNATRELLMEKKTGRPPVTRALVRQATPRPKFTIE